MKNAATSIRLMLGLSFALSVIGRAADAPTPTVGKVGDVALTEAQMKDDLSMAIYTQESQLYQLKRDWVNRQAKTILFDKAAKQAGLTRQVWEAKELAPAAPTDQEIDEMIRRMVPANQIPTDPVKLTQIRQQATDYIITQKKAQKENETFQRLAQADPVQVLLTPPTPPVIKIPEHSPVKGPENAKVTIFEFTDFQCPWCKKSQDNVKAMESVYGDKVKLVDRMFPLTSIHPHAMPSAEAAFCAKDQGKYWEMRDKLFASQTLSDDDFKQFAKDLKLNTKKFDKCLATHQDAGWVQQDMADAQTFGVTGTPTFFVNGEKANFQQLSDMVKAQLERSN